jgi:hypothetical protein
MRVGLLKWGVRSREVYLGSLPASRPVMCGYGIATGSRNQIMVGGLNVGSDREI